MSRRSKHLGDKPARDLWKSPYSVVPPLLRHLAERTHFIAPCAGDGRLVGYLQEHGHVCIAASDIEPLDPCIAKLDARQWESRLRYGEAHVIENPPWTREILHELILHCSMQHPTWFLFDLNWMSQVQSSRFLLRCRKIVAAGQHKWVEGSKHQSFDHTAWYLFTRDEDMGPPRFYPRKGSHA